MSQEKDPEKIFPAAPKLDQGEGSKDDERHFSHGEWVEFENGFDGFFRWKSGNQLTDRYRLYIGGEWYQATMSEEFSSVVNEKAKAIREEANIIRQEVIAADPKRLSRREIRKIKKDTLKRAKRIDEQVQALLRTIPKLISERDLTH